MNHERLAERKAELIKEREQAVAALNAISGAIQILDELIAEEHSLIVKEQPGE